MTKTLKKRTLAALGALAGGAADRPAVRRGAGAGDAAREAGGSVTCRAADGATRLRAHNPEDGAILPG